VVFADHVNDGLSCKDEDEVSSGVVTPLPS